MIYATAWHCDYVGDVTPTGMDCTVTATSTEEVATSTGDTGTTTFSGGYNGPNFNEWLFVSCVIIFFLAIVAWQRMFAKPRT